MKWNIYPNTGGWRQEKKEEQQKTKKDAGKEEKEREEEQTESEWAGWSWMCKWSTWWCCIWMWSQERKGRQEHLSRLFQVLWWQQHKWAGEVAWMWHLLALVALFMCWVWQHAGHTQSFTVCTTWHCFLQFSFIRPIQSHLCSKSVISLSSFLLIFYDLYFIRIQNSSANNL